MLKDVDPNFIKLSILKTDTIFLNCFPVTPNSHRVTEVTHAFYNGQRLIFVRTVSSTTSFVLVVLDCMSQQLGKLPKLFSCAHCACRMNGLGLTKKWLISEG